MGAKSEVSRQLPDRARTSPTHRRDRRGCEVVRSARDCRKRIDMGRTAPPSACAAFQHAPQRALHQPLHRNSDSATPRLRSHSFSTSPRCSSNLDRDFRESHTRCVAKKNAESRSKSLRLKILPLSYCSPKTKSRNSAKSHIPIDRGGGGAALLISGRTCWIEVKIPTLVSPKSGETRMGHPTRGNARIWRTGPAVSLPKGAAPQWAKGALSGLRR
jgi:hypothetical protein